MSGDFSRNTFDPKKHYSGVLMQQGRVQLDADWNEQQAIEQYHRETVAQDIIGPSGAPAWNPGFAIISDVTELLPEDRKRLIQLGILRETPTGFPYLELGNFLIGRGHYYVDGVFCENEEIVLFTGQPYLPSVWPLSGALVEPGHYLAYLDVWQRHITALDDPHIREVALGGPDTTTRLKTVWQVRLMSIRNDSDLFTNWNQLIAPSTGMLNARTKFSSDPQNSYLLPRASGYQGLENQLYRVEIHKGGNRNEATFKWSCENSSIETPVQNINGVIFTVADIGKNKLQGFAVGQWVEIVDNESELTSTPRPLVKVTGINPVTHEITIATSLAASDLASKPGLKLRRWDQLGGTADGVRVAADDWIELESGIQVQFSEGSYRSGDYWLIPARTATGEIEWPPYKVPNTQPLPQPPLGIRHRYCWLARLELKTRVSGIRVLKDYRQFFPSVTCLRKLYNPGIIEGLRVCFESNSKEEIASLPFPGNISNIPLKINPGIAIDAKSKEIMLLEPQIYTIVWEQSSFVNPQAQLSQWITIRFDQTTGHPVIQSLKDRPSQDDGIILAEIKAQRTEYFVKFTIHEEIRIVSSVKGALSSTGGEIKGTLSVISSTNSNLKVDACVGQYALYVKGPSKFDGQKEGYVVDRFMNASGQRIRTGDVVKLKGSPINNFQGSENKIPVPEVTLADKENDSLVIGIVDREAIPDYDAPDRRVEPDDPTFIEDGGELLVVTLGNYSHCKVDATAAPIEVGDLLTSSSNPGHAKKATDPKIGSIIGKALEPLREGTGYIAVFVNIQ
ncbi:MAG: DUF6519 domain-containing protein [Candidatus Competibacteraceae bacterium]